jgi:hypothetical protein
MFGALKNSIKRTGSVYDNDIIRTSLVFQKIFGLTELVDNLYL